MAVVAVDGGDERARAREGESREGRRGRERVRERSEGAAWLHPKRPGRSGKQEVAGVASALDTPRLCPSGEGGRRQGGKRLWARPLGELGQLGWTGKRQVSCWASLLFFYISVLFYFFLLFCFI